MPKWRFSAILSNLRRRRPSTNRNDEVFNVKIVFLSFFLLSWKLKLYVKYPINPLLIRHSTFDNNGPPRKIYIRKEIKEAKWNSWWASAEANKTFECVVVLLPMRSNERKAFPKVWKMFVLFIFSHWCSVESWGRLLMFSSCYHFLCTSSNTNCAAIVCSWITPRQ